MTSNSQAAQLVRMAYSLAADGGTAEVVRAFRECGLRPILLKGPAIASWLYGDDVRTYSDADMLVEPARLDEARAVLAKLGFEPEEEQQEGETPTVHAEPWWRRSDGAGIDLHHTLFGVGIPPERVWPVVSRDTGTLEIAGTDVEVPALHARALVITLHALQHGADVDKPLEDLRRLVAVAPAELWPATVDLAEQLEATITLSSGLGLVAGGDELARRLGLVDPAIATAALAGHGPLVTGIERLARRPGARAKLGAVARELFPAPGELRWADRTAGRPPLPLPLAYLRRLARLVRHTPGSVRAWRKARGRD